ncbi:UMP kinase [Buchnera aphidicola]|uniref:UMP kinase n=1 Tax=Buchnera aphidicola TaxID=9 RepID=UPI00346403ED
MNFIYKRIVFKISGEVIKGINKSKINDDVIHDIIRDIKFILNKGVEVSIVIGGGNLFRGVSLLKLGINRVTCDYIGMLSTVINGLFLKDLFNKCNVPVYLMSAIATHNMCNEYNLEKALHLLSKSVVVIFCGGLGQPFFTTDSVACLRAIETNSDIILKGTKVDGVYSNDPNNSKNSVFFHQLSYQDVLKNEFKIMDLTAFILARDYKIPICIFNINHKNALFRILRGEHEGTIIKDID